MTIHYREFDGTIHVVNNKGDAKTLCGRMTDPLETNTLSRDSPYTGTFLCENCKILNICEWNNE